MSMIRRLQPERCILLIVDLQERLLPAVEDSGWLTQQVIKLVEGAKALDLPIIVTEQAPEKLGPTHAELLKHCSEATAIFSKKTFGALADEAIATHLKSLHRDQLLLCGVESHICVSQTAHQLVESGYQPHVIIDAIGSRHKKDHKTALLKMQQSGVIPTTMEMALFELLHSAEHPAFKAIQRLIK